MQLPSAIANYLQETLLAKKRPFCFSIDSEYRLLDQWGDGEWCGLDGVEPGSDMRIHAPFLAGLQTTEVQSLEFVQSAQHAVVHVHLVPEAGDCYVILLDAQKEHGFRQEKQQSVNELRLLHARQNKLIGRQRELIGELVETRSELDHHRREAERTSDNKSRFIAMMSHEFRTPLASIVNYAELASEPGSTVNHVQKSIETIERSAKHLMSLVEAVLDDASFGAGQVVLVERSFDVRVLLEELAAMMAPMAAEKGLSFASFADSDLPAVVHGDDVRLRQVLINLLGNAVKFTQFGHVSMNTGYNNGRLMVTVSDSGPGISTEDQERVFRAFERGSASTGAGAGLGLTITLQLVEMMGGEVSLDSMPGCGCTVGVHVPMSAAREHAEDTAAVLSSPGYETMASKQRSVLICDDDEDMIALLEYYLHRAGYGLFATFDSSDAIEKALKYDPDLVLMDCNLPGVGGVVAARKLRERGFGKPIIALTASKLSAEEKNVFTSFYRKPAQMQELLAEVKRLTH